MIIIGVASGMFMSFAVFLKPLVNEFGWSRSITSMAYAINMIAMGIFSVLLGAVADRYGPRRVIFLGGIVFGFSLMLTSLTSTVWELYLYYGIIMALGSSSSQVPLAKNIAMWFEKKMGLATGISMAGYGFGPLIFAPLATYIMTVYSWQMAFIVIGAIGLATIVPVSLLIRSDPAEMGLMPYGHVPPSAKPNPGLASSTGVDKRVISNSYVGYSTLELLTNRPLLILMLVHFLGCVSHSIPLLHVVALATDAGVAKMVAATILGGAALWSLVSRIGIPILADRIGGKGGLFVTMMLQASTISWLFFAKESWDFSFFSIIFGIGYGGEMAMFPILSREYFGPASFGKIYGIQMFGAALGMAVGGYLAGLAFDLFGSYYLAIWLAVLTGLLGAVFTMTLPPAEEYRKSELIEEKKEAYTIQPQEG